MGAEPVVLTTAEAANALGVDRRTITRWVRSGHIKPNRELPHGGYVFTSQEIARVAAAQRPKRGGRRRRRSAQAEQLPGVTA